jgi:hypothetical protein
MYLDSIAKVECPTDSEAVQLRWDQIGDFAVLMDYAIAADMRTWPSIFLIVENLRLAEVPGKRSRRSHLECRSLARGNREYLSAANYYQQVTCYFAN